VDEVGLAFVGHQVLVGGVVAVPRQEIADGGPFGIGQHAVPKLMRQGDVGWIGEVDGVGQFVAEDGGAGGCIDGAAKAGDGDDRADGAGAEPALAVERIAEPGFVRVQRDTLRGGKPEEACEVGGAVVMPVIVAIRVTAGGADMAVEFRLGDDPVPWHVGFFDQRRDPVEHLRLRVQRREVEHEDGGIDV